MGSIVCDIAESDKGRMVFVCDINDNRCRYHPLQSKGEKRPLLKSFPCPLTFSYLYPSLFALHCRQRRGGAKGAGMEQRVGCAAQNQGVEFTLSYRNRANSIASFLQKYAARLMNLFIPFEARDFFVDYHVSRLNGSCPLGIKVGDTFTFNTDNREEVCPAAFHSIYPMGHLMESKCPIGCPDYRTHVSYMSAGNKITDGVCTVCDDYQVQVLLKKIHGAWDVPIKTGHLYTVDELIEKLGLKCLTSFYTAFPYLLALANGGQLGYLFHDRMKAGVCCPNDSCQVKYAVSKQRQGRYYYQCISGHPQCPRNLKDGDMVYLDNFEARVPFYSGLHDLLVVIKKWQHGAAAANPESMDLTTAYGEYRMEWAIRRT